MKHFNLLIEDFGLIEKADITLKPLTIFLGENNTGKSYVAQLIYALTRSISHIREPLLHYTHPSYRRGILSKKYDVRTIKAFSRRLPSDFEKALSSRKEVAFEVPFRDLPEIMGKECGDLVKSSLSSVQKYLERELKDA